MLLKIMFSVFVMAFLAGMLATSLTGCTYSINMVHTEGSASDVVDETQRANPDIKTNLSIPAL
jgi:hypothetical protein